MVPAIASRYFFGRPPSLAAATLPGAFGWEPYGPSRFGRRPAAAPWGFFPRPVTNWPYRTTYAPVYPGYGWPAGPAALPYGAWGPGPYSPWALPAYFHPYAPALAAGPSPYAGWLPAPATVPVQVVSPVMPVWYNQSHRPAPEAWTQGAPWAAPAVMTLPAPPATGLLAALSATAPLAAEPGVEVTADVSSQIFRETAA